MKRLLSFLFVIIALLMSTNPASAQALNLGVEYSYSANAPLGGGLYVYSPHADRFSLAYGGLSFNTDLNYQPLESHAYDTKNYFFDGMVGMKLHNGVWLVGIVSANYTSYQPMQKAESVTDVTFGGGGGLRFILLPHNGFGVSALIGAVSGQGFLVNLGFHF